MSDLPAPTDHNPAGTVARVSQATAVEQSRAVAEVQAAVVVAQQVPRSLATARTAMQQSCAMPFLAERAFYRFPRGGQQVSGASVYLARELARCWGNVQYGIAELRRDDEAGESEMQAWAWDVQTNARSSTTFIVPHKRDKRGGPERLTDMRDIYENNANLGARRLREVIFSVLPPWFTEEAKEICSKTLRGDDKDLAERVDGAIRAFEGIGVSATRLETKLGRPSDRWTTYDIAQLVMIHRSIQRGESAIEDEFPQPRVTRAEIEGEPPAGDIPPPPQDPPPAADRPQDQVDQRPPTKTMVAQLNAAVRGAGIDDGLAWAARLVGRKLVDFTDLTRDDVARLVGELEHQEAS